MKDDLAERLSAIYAGPPEEFVAERGKLAAEAKAVDPELARMVAAARRPTLTAWAVNRLRASEPEVFEVLVDSGRRLRQAVVAGDPSEALADRQRALAEALGAVDREWPTASGPTLEQRRRIGDTLQALSVGLESDPRIAEGLAGRLSRDLEPPGLESLVGIAPGRRRKGPSRSEGKVSQRSAGEDDGDGHLCRDEEQRRAEDAKEKRRIQRRLGRVGKRRDALEQELEGAREKVLGLQEELEKARTRRAELRSEVDALESERRELEQQARDLG